MPITQDRMISLVIAARDYQHGLQQAVRLIKEALTAANNSGDAMTELRRLHSLADEAAMLSSPLASNATILLEEKHFNTMSQRNTRKAEKNRVKRRKHNIRPALTAPTSIIPNAPVLQLSRSERREEGVKAASAETMLDIQFTGIDEATKRQIEQESEMTQRADEFIEAEKKRKEQQALRDSADKGLYDPPDDVAPILTSESVAEEPEEKKP